MVYSNAIATSMLHFNGMIFRRAVLPILSSCLMAGAVLAACSPPSPKRHSDAEVAFLASDAYLVVGDVPLIVPFVALTGLAEKPSFSLDRKGDRQAAEERLEAFRKTAGSPETAPVIDKLEITVRPYGWDDSDAPFRRICLHLSRQWSRSVCNDPSAPLQRAMPKNTFFLADDRKLNTFRNYSIGSGETVSDHLDRMPLKPMETSVVCDAEASSETTLCTAATPIRQHLIAVWRVWGSSAEATSRQAEREGVAITAFVLHALGPAENFPALTSVACGLTKPVPSSETRGDACP
ncbi:hypothetical protein [Rhizobium sp. CF142]|uniref:hypothetical protein n=1 Tax=Rhizobium sp. CF142 TaxID=1144314 RepID=UPI00026EF9B9|nr:hypothetical protein [Rhizobium sp. CF142]EJJ28761.1 hypothetical protein PMI11_02963 [Rhizobium sp. CF142]